LKSGDIALSNFENSVGKFEISLTERLGTKLQKTNMFAIIIQRTFVKRTFSESQRIKYETLLKYMTHINVRMNASLLWEMTEFEISLMKRVGGLKKNSNI